MLALNGTFRAVRSHSLGVRLTHELNYWSIQMPSVHIVYYPYWSKAWWHTLSSWLIDCVCERPMVTVSNSDGCGLVPLLVGFEGRSPDSLDAVTPSQIHRHKEWDTGNLRMWSFWWYN